MGLFSSYPVRKARNYLLVRRAKKALLINPDAYPSDKRKAGIQGVSEHGGDNHYKLTYGIKGKPSVSFSYERNNPVKTLKVRIEGDTLSLNAKLTARFASYLRYYHGNFMPKPGGGTTFIM